jgi:small subunit ribosomal protein S2
MQSIEKMLGDGSFDSITKKERLTLTRDKDKMEKVLGGIAQLGRVPAALFIVDIGHEHIALAEAKRLGITTIGVVDTNCDPNKVDFAIPANDDATKSIAIISDYITAAIAEGLAERQAAKDEEGVDEMTDDEKERKAARLEAEAQAEGGRGGRGGGRGAGNTAGGGQPKRRMPSTQRRPGGGGGGR